MILRGNRENKSVLVAQTDHSQLVGQMASHWGNNLFDSPKPYDSVVRGAIYHDYAWLLYETSPRIDPSSHQPYGFLQLPLGKSQLAAYQWLLDWMNNQDPYSALLMSRHRTGLWKARYETIKYPKGYNLSKPSPEIAEFIERNEQWQEKIKAGFDADTFDFNYRLLQVWDLLGLYFCCHEVGEDYIDPVPVSYSKAPKEGVRMKMTPLSTTKVKFDPYPFDVNPVKIQLRYKLVEPGPFEDDLAFRKAYFQAANELIEYELSS
ncbi:MAG: DUF3891 family protein [Candidatus Binatus sp.]|uniref:DUF3891 family protein n=1 Tax=Candidatus Binatus sp. TaxID=2811406 RepID=UPI003BAF6D5F